MKKLQSLKSFADFRKNIIEEMTSIKGGIYKSLAGGPGDETGAGEICLSDGRCLAYDADVENSDNFLNPRIVNKSC